MTQPIFQDLEDTGAFGSAPLPARHRLHLSPLFEDAALARLIEATPRERYHINTVDPARRDPAQRWREGDVGRASGDAVLAAVRRGRIWVHLQRVQEHDAAFAALLDQIFDELEQRVGGLKTFRRSMSILVSSPRIPVAYHCDVPGQSLWQIHGRKRLFVYPAKPPFLPQRALEAIVLKKAVDTALVYEPWFDQHATIVDLAPGDCLHWPLNWPHRVDNEDCVNVSFTTEYWTKDLQARYAVNYANGLLRSVAGGRPLSQAVTGPAFAAKFALAGAHKTLGLRGRAALKFNIDFEIDPTMPDGIRDIPAFPLGR